MSCGRLPEGNLDALDQNGDTQTADQDASCEALIADHRKAVRDVLLKHSELAADTIAHLSVKFQKSQNKASWCSVQSDFEMNSLWNMAKPVVEAREPLQPSLQPQMLGLPISDINLDNMKGGSITVATSSTPRTTAREAGTMKHESAMPLVLPKNDCNGIQPAKLAKSSSKAFYRTKASMTASPADIGDGSETHHLGRGGRHSLAHSKRKAGRGVFVDVEAIKIKIRQEMAKPPYNVADFYHETGFFQAVATSFYFETLTLWVIAANALYIAVDVDLNHAPMIIYARPEFIIFDNIFCIFFFFEWFVRFMSFRRKRDGLRDTWFIFDTFLCALMVIETWAIPLAVVLMDSGASGTMREASVLKGFRLVRLVRMARIIRLLNALPELMVMVKGMAVAFRAVSCTVVLMLVVVYVFSIVFRQLTAGTSFGNKHFKSLLSTMRILILQGSVPELADLALDIWDENVLYALVFVFFILVVTLTVMNMLVGVLVGVVNAVATLEREQLTVNFVRENLMEVLRSVQGDQSLHEEITKEDFGNLLQRHDAIAAFNMMGVDVFGLVDLTDFIFRESRPLEFSEFMELVMQLRGSNQATVKDIVDLRKFIVNELKTARDQMKPQDMISSMSPSMLTFGNEHKASVMKQYDVAAVAPPRITFAGGDYQPQEVPASRSTRRCPALSL